MTREIKKFEENCDSLICGLFEVIVLPTLRKRAIKLGIDYISESNNYWFFKIKGKDIIEDKFCDLGKKYKDFFDKNMRPISNARYLYPKNINFSMYA